MVSFLFIFLNQINSSAYFINLCLPTDLFTVYHTNDVSEGGWCYCLIFQLFLFVCLFLFLLNMNFDNKISSWGRRGKKKKKEIEKRNLYTIIFGRSKIYAHVTKGEKVEKKTNTE